MVKSTSCQYPKRRFSWYTMWRKDKFSWNSCDVFQQAMNCPYINFDQLRETVWERMKTCVCWLSWGDNANSFGSQNILNIWTGVSIYFVACRVHINMSINGFSIGVINIITTQFFKQEVNSVFEVLWLSDVQLLFSRLSFAHHGHVYNLGKKLIFKSSYDLSFSFEGYPITKVLYSWWYS